ncbi:MAG: glycerophosphodiester phosphodiesterase family protein [Ahrensia sp.]|nr:glycerophosphodiester phosphodiesterase family protein [Ahrensia sp.]
MSLGPRPFVLVDGLKDGSLKTKLAACTGPFREADWSIAHRGAPLQFPEHSREGYIAAARMGTGFVECDVTFTKDKQLVCRHSQADLHRTTNILATDLAAKCTKPFSPAKDDKPADAQCLTSDLTLSEFKSLRAKHDFANPAAASVEDYMYGAKPRSDRSFAADGTVMSHAETLALFADLGVKFAPELKRPAVDMPFDGFSQRDYTQALVDAYKAARIPPSQVMLQSFSLEDVRYWIENEPEFGRNAIYLESGYRNPDWSPEKPQSWAHSMEALVEMGVTALGPPIWVLLRNDNGKIVPSTYAKQARAAGLKLIAWSLERSGSLSTGGGWYYQSVADLITSDSDMLKVLDVLANDVGVAGVFSDWPATTTFFANCFDLP